MKVCILKRRDKVYTLVVENIQTETLLPVIKKKIQLDSVVYTDSLSSYDVLDVSEFRHVRINHSERFAERANHINGIENFWSQAKRVLRKYNRPVRQPMFRLEHFPDFHSI